MPSPQPIASTARPEDPAEREMAKFFPASVCPPGEADLPELFDDAARILATNFPCILSGLAPGSLPGLESIAAALAASHPDPDPIGALDVSLFRRAVGAQAAVLHMATPSGAISKVTRVERDLKSEGDGTAQRPDKEKEITTTTRDVDYPALASARVGQLMEQVSCTRATDSKFLRVGLVGLASATRAQRNRPGCCGRRGLRS